MSLYQTTLRFTQDVRDVSDHIILKSAQLVMLCGIAGAHARCITGYIFFIKSNDILVLVSMFSCNSDSLTPSCLFLHLSLVPNVVLLHA